VREWVQAWRPAIPEAVPHALMAAYLRPHRQAVAAVAARPLREAMVSHLPVAVAVAVGVAAVAHPLREAMVSHLPVGVAVGVAAVAHPLREALVSRRPAAVEAKVALALACSFAAGAAASTSAPGLAWSLA
jgi:hypothetical protein